MQFAASSSLSSGLLSWRWGGGEGTWAASPSSQAGIASALFVIRVDKRAGHRYMQEQCSSHNQRNKDAACPALPLGKEKKTSYTFPRRCRALDGVNFKPLPEVEANSTPADTRGRVA